VSPLLALADCLRRRDPALRVTVLGTRDGLEQRLVPARGYELRTIPKVAFPRRPSAAFLRLPGALKGAVDAAGAVIDETAPDVVVGFGGYVSTPAYLAARQREIPIVVHEQNARPGLANRLGARMTPYVATTFASTSLRHGTAIGMPLRREIATLDRAASRAKGLAHFGLDDHRPTLLITGGSLGAQRLNLAFELRVDQLRAHGIQVLHISGLGKEFATGLARSAQSVAAGPSYVVAAYVDRMELAYAAADVVVARAGANTVCELTAVGLPAVYVPLPVGNGEQRLNAADVVAAGGGILVDDSSLTPRWIDEMLVPLVTDGPRIAAMASAAAAMGEPAADERLADLVARAADSRRAR